ncbi:MAG: hypothetical protein M0Z46_13920 [Actinomycetota bacterium]|nr:hypothetical protein [Actinomycetota bacterium]
MSIGAVTGASAYSTVRAPSAVQTAAGQASTKTAQTSSLVNQLRTPTLFLKLLIDQLQHQDPTNPTTPSSILQQTAALSQVEAVTSMTAAVAQEEHGAQESEATSLLGKQVTAIVSGLHVSGAVSGVELSSTGTPTLLVGSERVPLSAVTEVGSPSSPS